MTVEHVFRPRTSAWVWLAFLACIGAGIGAGYLLGVRLGLVVASGALIALAGRPFAVRLERDPAGTPYLVAGRRKARLALDLARLEEVELHAGGYLLRDRSGTTMVAPLDERLRHEVAAAAARQGLALAPETDIALQVGVVGEPRRWLPLISVGWTAFMSVGFLALAIGFGGGIDLRRDYRVEVEELRADDFPGPPANWFAAGPDARELYLVPLDRPSQRRLARLSRSLERAFGMRPAVTPGWSLDPALLDRGRGQIDGWRTLQWLAESHDAVHEDTPAIIVGVTDHDTWNPQFQDSRYALITSFEWHDWRGCGGVISTARVHLWPGSVDERLAKLAGRLVARCLRIPETIVVRGASDVDALDERGGADPATIAERVAARRALSFAPAPLPPTPAGG